VTAHLTIDRRVGASNRKFPASVFRSTSSQNADLTWAQDLGAVTELLSGEFYRWLGRSTSHQLWSSTRVLTPAIRGMFGLEWNAAEKTRSTAR